MNTFNLQTQLDFDVTNSPYFNVNIESEMVKPYLTFLERNLSIEVYQKYTENQKKRDQGKHHVTIVDPLEYVKIPSEKVMIHYPITLNLLGIGTIKEVKNEVYFIVCISEELDNIRSYFCLPPKNFHITLGFKEHDIFDKPKDRTTLISPYKQIEK